MGGPHVKKVDSRWRIRFLHILQEVRPICKTRNQFSLRCPRSQLHQIWPRAITRPNPWTRFADTPDVYTADRGEGKARQDIRHSLSDPFSGWSGPSFCIAVGHLTGTEEPSGRRGAGAAKRERSGHSPPVICRSTPRGSVGRACPSLGIGWRAANLAQRRARVPLHRQIPQRHQAHRLSPFNHRQAADGMGAHEPHGLLDAVRGRHGE
jgi:hypothetical protein